MNSGDETTFLKYSVVTFTLLRCLNTIFKLFFSSAAVRERGLPARGSVAPSHDAPPLPAAKRHVLDIVIRLGEAPSSFSISSRDLGDTAPHKEHAIYHSPSERAQPRARRPRLGRVALGRRHGELPTQGLARGRAK